MEDDKRLESFENVTRVRGYVIPSNCIRITQTCIFFGENIRKLFNLDSKIGVFINREKKKIAFKVYPKEALFDYKPLGFRDKYFKLTRPKKIFFIKEGDYKTSIDNDLIMIEYKLSKKDAKDETEKIARKYPKLKEILLDKRNVFMTSKIAELLIDDPEKRIAIIVGIGHKEFLDEVFNG